MLRSSYFDTASSIVYGFVTSCFFATFSNNAQKTPYCYGMLLRAGGTLILIILSR